MVRFQGFRILERHSGQPLTYLLGCPPFATVGATYLTDAYTPTWSLYHVEASNRRRLIFTGVSHVAY